MQDEDDMMMIDELDGDSSPVKPMTPRKIVVEVVDEIDELASDYEDSTLVDEIILPKDRPLHKILKASITELDYDNLKSQLITWSDAKLIASSTTSTEPW
jgi:hypothetical protein